MNEKEGSNFNLLSFLNETIEPKSVKQYLYTIDHNSIFVWEPFFDRTRNLLRTTGWWVLWEHLLFDLGCENYFSLTWDVKIIQPHRSNTCSWIAMGAKKGTRERFTLIGKRKIMQQPWLWNYQTAETQTRVSEEVFAWFEDWKLDSRTRTRYEMEI